MICYFIIADPILQQRFLYDQLIAVCIYTILTCLLRGIYLSSKDKHIAEIDSERYARIRNKGSLTDNSQDWYLENATVQAATILTKELMAKYNIPADRVIRHHDVTGKICPNPYVYNHTSHTWDAFEAVLVVC